MTDFATRLNEMLSQPVLPWTIVGVIVVGVLLGQVQKHVPDDPIERMKRLFGVPNIPHGLALLIAVLWGALLLVLFVGLVTLLYEIVWGMTAPVSRDDEGDFRFLLAKITALTAVLGALVALPFTALRLKLIAQQTKTTEQSYIAEVLNKSGENLAADKIIKKLNTNEKTVELSHPSLQRRILGILALERLAGENPEYHIQMLDMLVAYIRENAPASSAKQSPHEVFAELTKDTEHGQGLSAEDAFKHYQYRAATPYGWNPTELNDRTLAYWAREYLTIREDIQTALNVIGRRQVRHIVLEEQENYQIDLRNTNLQGAKLKGNFDSAQFSDARMNATLFEGSFKNCQFGIYTEQSRSGASLQAARTIELDATGADFSGTNLDAAFFGGAIMNKCLFRSAQMDHTNFNGASLRESDFAFTSARHVYCHQNAQFERARFFGTNLNEFRGIEDGPTHKIWLYKEISTSEAEKVTIDLTISELDDRRKWSEWANPAE